MQTFPFTRNGMGLLFWATLLPHLQGECILIGTYLITCLSSFAVGAVTSYECFFGKSPIIGHLYVFGCRCYAITLGARDKLCSHVIPSIFIGYPFYQKGYCMYDPILGKFLSGNVIFCEDVFLLYCHNLCHPLIAWPPHQHLLYRFKNLIHLLCSLLMTQTFLSQPFQCLILMLPCIPLRAQKSLVSITPNQQHTPSLEPFVHCFGCSTKPPICSSNYLCPTLPLPSNTFLYLIS